jgi:hypothetical protein
MRIAYTVLFEKPVRKRPLGRHEHKWECNIKIDLKEIVWVDVDWIHLTQVRVQWWAVVNMLMNLQLLKDQEFLD